MFTWVVVVLAWGGGLAWIADAAASRGRSQVGWAALAVVISMVSFHHHRFTTRSPPALRPASAHPSAANAFCARS
jgi:hypothetical protein